MSNNDLVESNHKLSSGLARRDVLVGVAAAGLGLTAALWSVRQKDAAVTGPGTGPETASSTSDGGPAQALKRLFHQAAATTPEGAKFELASFDGRPLVLNFWATWCPPCVREFPALDAFHRERQRSGWGVLALAIDQPAAVRGFLAKHPVSFPVGILGVEGMTPIRELGNQQGGLPYSLVINRRGVIAHSVTGELDFAKLNGWVDALG
jgi:thiol-disulfide isomerase/thioredoxin